jgi:serine/threonine-protein kinase
MEDLEPGTRVGEYRIEHELGRGGMSVVYAATHLVIEKRVAIKVVSPLLSADATGMLRAIQEARAINQISHPNVVDVYAYGKLPDGRCYLVMERLDGESLHERMGRRPIGCEEALDILLPLCDALEAAHDRGVVHRDVKPANVYLVPVRGRADEVKLLDFGLAKLLVEDSSITLEGAVMGTPDYIAPEQARGGIVDARADVYSLGVVAFEMLAGRLPFSGESSASLLRQHTSCAPPRLRDYWGSAPPALEQLIEAMLKKDPTQRPSISEVRSRLYELRHPQPIRRTRKRWRVAAIAAALSLVSAGVVLGARGKKPLAPKPAPIAPLIAQAVTALPRLVERSTPPKPKHHHKPRQLSDQQQNDKPQPMSEKPQPMSEKPQPMSDELIDPFN